ncbi:MAG: UDP-N-acetylmuramate dehydrogenase [Candidatus Cloacimonetes bacterium]|nr:UDP-N-acetylmuramate dehydrogenase [Candidatus Cloacimonadota bacterium]
MEKVFDSKTLTSILSESSLKDYSNIRIGGKAKYLFIAKRVSDLSLIITQANKANLKILPVGGASNILFGNVGDRVLILDRDIPQNIAFKRDEIVVSSNYNINAFIDEMMKHDLGGLEFLSGIPAHIGGAVHMNAGAFGKSISSYLEWIEIISIKGKREIIQKEELHFDYRKTSINGFIINAAFKLESKPEKDILTEVQNIISTRKVRHPYDYPSLGSTFKNPAGYFAGKLIEECELKGTRIGDAEVSKKHANFIINRGNAVFDDMIKLIELIKKEVFEKKGIMLELEIKVIN